MRSLTAELKAELTEKVRLYETIVYTDDQIQEAKKDKANLTQTKAELEAKYHSLMDANRLYVGMRGRLNGS